MDADLKKEAYKLLKELSKDDYDEDTDLLFINSVTKEKTPLDSMELEAGLSGHVSYSPIVILIDADMQEDPDEVEFDMSLVQCTSSDDVSESTIGAFVKLPNKAGDGYVDSFQLLDSEEAVTEFLENWGIE